MNFISGLRFLSLLICFASAVKAQTNLNIYLNDGTSMQIPVSNLDSLTFINGATSGAIEVVTQPPLNVTHNTASVGGEITTSGTFTSLYRGVCWDTVPMPTLAASYASDPDSGTGSFSFNISTVDNLFPETTHYVRAYAMNENLTVYGDEQQFTLNSAHSVGNGVADIDGNTYSSVIIGNQEWMVENLQVKRYNNGDSVQHTPGVSEWANSNGIGAYCSYDNDPQYDSIYGNLYNWYAVADPRNLCPIGWHVPSDVEWYTLSLFLDPEADTACVSCYSQNIESTVAGTFLKEAGFQHWEDQLYIPGGTNSVGFTALPGGERRGATPYYALMGNIGTWWTSTEYYTPWAYYRTMNDDGGNVLRADLPKTYGFSVRCVKD